jgi:arylsulfatase
MAAKMRVYAAQITRMDEGIGRILQQLKANGQQENTLVIFLSDNGASAEGGIRGFDKRHNGLPPGGVDSYMSYGESWAGLSNTPFRYYKTWLHEGGIATPFIVRWPAAIDKGRDGSVVDQTGHVIDIMPTLCAVAGAVYPRRYKGDRIIAEQGQSLLGPIETGKAESHRPLYWSLKGHKAMLADGFKLVSTGDGRPWELYDLSRDRTELHNLAAKDTALVRKYSAAWKAWAHEVGVFQGRQESGRQ